MRESSPITNKVAQVTFAFWILKICATTLGETGGDLLSMTLGVGYGASSLILVAFFLLVLAAQVRAARFHPLLYWSVILLTSTAGTTMSDFMDRSLGLGYARGSALLIALLAAALGAWRLSEGSLSVSRIRTRRAELFYWAAILCSNTLGTAFGDYLSDASGLGFARCALLIGGAIALCAMLYRFTRLSRVALFWAAFVLTRPFGAEAGDLLTKTHAQGGLALGTLGASLVLLAVFVAGLWATRGPRPEAA
ncbi:MAG TPA: hypothetical protein VFM16_03670 [Holophagaceae bacterium]|nr:hypothetical protein [Holophagaceae bacterium]